jgi:hypothetical protein
VKGGDVQREGQPKVLPVRKRFLLLSFAALAAGSPALAQETAPTEEASAHRLSETEKERLLDEAVERRELLEEALPPPKRQVRGEVGVAVGSGGFRSIYGVSEVPLGEAGTAIISFENTDWGNRGRARRHRR